MLVVYRIQNSILSKIKYNLFFIDTLVIECCQIVGNNTAYRHLYGHLINLGVGKHITKMWGF